MYAGSIPSLAAFVFSATDAIPMDAASNKAKQHPDNTDDDNDLPDWLLSAVKPTLESVNCQCLDNSQDIGRIQSELGDQNQGF